MALHKLKFKTGGTGTGTGTTHFPFQITTHSDQNHNPYITVWPGTVSGLIPDNIFDPIYIDNVNTFYVKLLCQTDGKIPTYIYLFIDNQPIDNNNFTAQSSPPPDFEIIIGMIKARKPYQIVFTNLAAAPIVAFLESRLDAEENQEPFFRWWNWLTYRA